MKGIDRKAIQFEVIRKNKGNHAIAEAGMAKYCCSLHGGIFYSKKGSGKGLSYEALSKTAPINDAGIAPGSQDFADGSSRAG